MKKLFDLTKNLQICQILNSHNAHVDKITDNSVYASKGSLFVAIEGISLDGHDYIADAVERGVSVIAVNEGRNILKKTGKLFIPVVIVKDTKKFLLKVLENFYSVTPEELLNNSSEFSLVSVTGTNGKTSTCYFIEKILNESGKKTGKFTTVESSICGSKKDSVMTTPDAVILQAGIRRMIDSGCRFGIIETSSHGLSGFRIDPAQIHTAVITNITRDHLDYHKTMKNYVESKKKLFEGLSRNAFAVLNKDDKFYSDFKSSVSANIMTYGLGNNSDFQAKEIRQNYSGSKFKILYPEGIINIDTKHIGTHNIYNILASTAAVYCASGKLIHEKVSLAFKDGINVPGRLQEVPYKGKFKIFVDYAHTPDALSKILENLKSFSSSRILLVFGCGGNRDKGKRPVMGKIAAKFCDYFIITNDNPRSENPGKIADDIASGIPKNFKNYSIILNRAEAINKILQTANENDVVIIAGKGHEKKQIIKNKKIPFDDYLTAKSILKK